MHTYTYTQSEYVFACMCVNCRVTKQYINY